MGLFFSSDMCHSFSFNRMKKHHYPPLLFTVIDSEKPSKKTKASEYDALMEKYIHLEKAYDELKEEVQKMTMKRQRSDDQSSSSTRKYKLVFGSRNGIRSYYRVGVDADGKEIPDAIQMVDPTHLITVRGVTKSGSLYTIQQSFRGTPVDGTFRPYWT